MKITLEDVCWIINHYRVLAVDLSRQKELDADSNAIQQIGIVGQLKKIDANGNAGDVGNYQSMIVLAILEKIKETRRTISEGSIYRLI